jgi:DNA-binding IclR family transcriptional regulator
VTPKPRSTAPAKPAAKAETKADIGYRGPHLQSLQRGLAVLFHLARTSTGLTAREVAEAMGIERTISYRILRTLESERMVSLKDGRYSVGVRSMLIGQAYLDNLVLRHVAMPLEVDLLFRTFAGRPWSVGLSLAIDDQLAIVDELWAPNAPLNTIMSVGTVLPLEQTSAGRAILAARSDEEVIAIIGEERYLSVRDRLAEVRKSGVEYTRDVPHAPAGIVALGAAIIGRSGQPLGGLSISGPGMDEFVDPTSEVATELHRTAEQIGRACP